MVNGRNLAGSQRDEVSAVARTGGPESDKGHQRGNDRNSFQSVVSVILSTSITRALREAQTPKATSHTIQNRAPLFTVGPRHGNASVLPIPLTE